MIISWPKQITTRASQRLRSPAVIDLIFIPPPWTNRFMGRSLSHDYDDPYCMDYRPGGNSAHLVVGSEMAKMESGSGSDTGLIALLVQINKALHRRTSEELLGMRLKSFLLLGYVRDRGAVSQQELETGLLMDANSVVLLLNETEAAGFSVRRRDPADRRRHMVELTAAGRVAVERAEKAREGIEDEVLSDLSPEERKTLRKLLRRVLDGLLMPAPDTANL